MAIQLAVAALLCGALVFPKDAEGHGRLMEPPMRSSIWRDPRFAHLNLPPNYDDGGLWCGGVRQGYIPTECGVCGDIFTAPLPRPNENGGTFGNAVMAGNYTKGQVRNIRHYYYFCYSMNWYERPVDINMCQ